MMFLRLLIEASYIFYLFCNIVDEKLMLGRDVLFDREIRKAAGHCYSGQEEGGKGLRRGVLNVLKRRGGILSPQHDIR